MSNIEIKPFSNENDLKVALAVHYQKQIVNYFGDEKRAMAFLSAVVAATQRLPDLLKCTPVSVINSFMMMAQLGFMPSGVSGEAFVLPYKNKGVLEAQFQLGYQGIVTLLYGAGARDIVTELVREHDVFRLSNGKVYHEVNPLITREARGKVIGVYAIITTATGGTVDGFMRMEDILAHAKKFSKSFGGDYSPWNEKNDPEGWMPRKTVLKQVSKLAPKNEKLLRAIQEDNKDSIIGDRLPEAEDQSKSLTMGSLIKPNNAKPKSEKAKQDEVGAEDQSKGKPTDAEGDQSADQSQADNEQPPK